MTFAGRLSGVVMFVAMVAAQTAPVAAQAGTAIVGVGHERFQIAQLSNPWDDDAAAGRPARKPPAAAPKQRPPAAPAPSAAPAAPPAPAAVAPAANVPAPAAATNASAPFRPASSVDVELKGRTLRIAHDRATAKLVVYQQGRVAASVEGVGSFEKPELISSSPLSLVRIPTNAPDGKCASNVLIAFPDDLSLSPQMQTRFGGCNSQLRTVHTKRGEWSTWILVAYGEDGAHATVALPRAGQMKIDFITTSSCLHSSGSADCIEEVIATAQGSAERGVQTGEAAGVGRRLMSYLHSKHGIGTLELNGRSIRRSFGIKEFHVESGQIVPGGSIFSVWVKPNNEFCGHRLIVHVPLLGDGIDVHERVGSCRSWTANQTRLRTNRTVESWVKIMFRPGDRQVDIAYWQDGRLRLGSIDGDLCLIPSAINPGSPQVVAQECQARLFPSNLALIGPVRTGPLAALPHPPGGRILTQPPTVMPSAPPVPRFETAPVPAPASPYTSQAGGHVAKAFDMLARGETDPALAEFDRALMADPNNVWAFAGRGYGLALKGKLDNAMTDLDRAVQLNPRLAQAYSFRGFVFVLRLEPDRALAQLDHALTLNPKLPDALMFRGMAWHFKKDFEKAIADLDRAIELRPRNASAFAVRARLYAERKEHARAIDDFDAALRIKPGDVAQHVGRGQSLEALGRTAEAKAAYELALGTKAASVGDAVYLGIARRLLDALAKAESGTGCRPGQSCL